MAVIVYRVDSPRNVLVTRVLSRVVANGFVSFVTRGPSGRSQNEIFTKPLLCTATDSFSTETWWVGLSPPNVSFTSNPLLPRSAGFGGLVCRPSYGEILALPG